MSPEKLCLQTQIQPFHQKKIGIQTFVHRFRLDFVYVVGKIEFSSVGYYTYTLDPILAELYPRLAEEGLQNSALRMWETAAERMRKARTNRYTIAKPPGYPESILEKGTLIWINLNGRLLKASVLKDYGDTCVVQKDGKLGLGRYGKIGVHKSRISRRL